MGMSAHQGMALYLTARDYQITHEIGLLTGKKKKLILEEADITRRANEIRNTKTLVFRGVNGEGDDEERNLTYNALMGEGAYNESERNRYFIVDPHNRIVLDSATAKAAKDAGITPGKTGSVDANNFESFMNSLGKNKISKESWYNLATGNATTELTDADKANLSSNFVFKYGEYPTSQSSSSVSQLLDKMSNYKVDGVSIPEIYNGTDSFKELYDDDENSGYGDTNTIKQKADAYLKCFMNAILKAFEQTSDSPLGQLLQGYVDDIQSGLDNYDATGGKADRSSGATPSSNAKNGETSEVFTTWATSTKGKDRDHFGVRAQTLLKRMIEIARQYMSGSGTDGRTSSLSSQSSSSTCNQNINSRGYSISEYEKYLKNEIGADKFEAAVRYLKGDNSNIPDTDTAKFYYDLFTQICQKGYTEDANINDASHLQAQFQNGTYQIVSNKKDDYKTPTNIHNSELGIYETVVGGDKWDEEAQYYKDMKLAEVHRKESDIDEQLTVKNTELTAVRNWRQNEHQEVLKEAQSAFHLFAQA